MKIFAQQCTRCDEYITAELINERPKHLVKWLHKWIANKFYGFPNFRSRYRGKETDQHHLKDRCEACIAGWCHYLKARERRINRHVD
jgi:hypothetical protein